MKTIREYVKSIKLNKANVEHCLEHGVINGSLLIDIENVLKSYGEQCIKNYKTGNNICGQTCDCISREQCQFKPTNLNT